MVYDSIIYDGGFTFTWSPEMAGNIIKNVTHIKLAPADSAEQAYLQGASEYFKKEYWASTQVCQPIMPTFEVLQSQGFLRPGAIPQIPMERHFAAVSGDEAAYLRSAESIVEFLREYPWGIVLECNSAFEVQKAVNFLFFRRIMKFGAYLGMDVPMIRELPPDEIVETGFSKWWDEQRSVIPPMLTSSNPLRQIVDVTPLHQRGQDNGRD